VERARVVIGADGHNSRIARAVRPGHYHEKPVLETAVYTYWSGLPVDAFSTFIRGDRGFAAIPTNDGLTLVLVGCPASQSVEFKADVEGNYHKALELAPEFAERFRVAKREDRFTAGGVPNFFRTPYGPGWALVGDAGYTKDPITGQGITDAFRDAELCSSALDHWLNGACSFQLAMSDYQQRRDQRVLALYEFTTQMATLEPPPPEMQQLLGATQGDQAAMNQFVSVTAGTMSPVEFFDPENVGRILGASQGAAPTGG
jgi:flavin-dependent dehydrogenase